jgi:uncharacterized protein (TIGR03435 family)
MKILLVTAMSALYVGPVSFTPQQTETKASQAFEVASFKPDLSSLAGGEGSARESIVVSGNRLTMSNVTLRTCINWAYRLRAYQLTGPSWIDSDRYDIVAKGAGQVSEDQLRLMLRRLLADRIELQLRREMKDIPVYAMSVGKNGHKMRPPAAVDGKGNQTFSGGGMVFQNFTMEEFAERLSMQVRPFRLDRVVFDKTGLDGRFDFTLQLAENPAALKHAFESLEQSGDGGALLAIIEEQLGLRFQSQRAPGETFTIVRAEKVPSEN